MYKNVASQKIAIYAHNTATDAPKTGDAANITAYLSKDGGAVAQTNDVNPSELDATNAKGIYIFDMLQAETNADMLALSPVSATDDIQIEPVFIYTVPAKVTLSDATEAQIDAIEGDTDELQTNQGNWATATGFATPTNVTDSQTAIVAEVDGNETKIDALNNLSAQNVRDAMKLAPSGNSPAAGSVDKHLDDVEGDTNELQGLIADSKMAAQVKGMDDIDLSATMKASVNTEVDNALDTAIPGAPTADSINERVAAISEPPTAAAIVDEWESQSQADPTGFHVNVMEWLSQACAAVSVNGVPEVDFTHIMGTILTEGGAGRLAAALVKLLDVATPALVASDVMRGTDNAAIEANVEGHVTNSLNSYDPPTRAEATADKDAIIVEVNANETKIDTMQIDVTSILTDTNEIQGLISDSKMAAQVKGMDDIDLSATMKASVNTEVDNALDTAIPGAPTADSINERVAAISEPPTAAAIVDEWESQSQADPTGFHVNVMEWLSQACAAVSVNGVPEVDFTHIMGTILTEGGAGRLAAALVKLLDVATPALVASDVMRGTDNAAIEANVEGHVTNSLNSYDPPTRAEATADKDAIIVEVNANETKIDTMQIDVTSILTDTNEIQGLISDSKMAAQVKGMDDIDLSATMKASVNTEVDNALDTAIPGAPTADSINERVAAISEPPTAAAIVDEWESQSQADPTGFHVNVMEWLSQACAAVSVNGVPEVDFTHIMGTILTEGGAGRLAAALVKLLDVATPALVASDVMRGTDNAAIEANVEGHVTNSLNSYDPPTRAEATADKDAIIVEVNANETKIDTMQIDVTSILTDTNEIQGLISDSKMAAQVKGIDNIDLSATMKASVNTEVDNALDTAIPGAPTADSINERVAAIDDKLPSKDYLAGTDNSDGDVEMDEATGNFPGSVASVAGAVGSVAGAVGSVTGNVGGSVGSLAAQAKADVNDQVLDVINVDTFTEPGQGAPTATPTLRQMMHYIYKRWRNKETQTSSDYKLYANDGVTVDQKATVSDDGATFTKGEIGTGA